MADTERPVNSRPTCGQCGKPAIVMLDDLPLCVDCNYKFEQTNWMRFAQNAALFNMADRQMANATGMYHLQSPIDVPPAPVPPIHYNNQSVTIHGGNVGAVNLGNVDEIKVSLQALVNEGSPALSEAIAGLTGAVLDSNAAPAAKDDLLENLAFLSSQAAAQPAERNKVGVIKSVFDHVKAGAGAVGSAAAAWQNLEPLLRAHFNI